MSLPVILRQEAEVDVQEARDQLEAVRVGLGTQVLARVREVLARIEKMPELHGKVWQDVRAARLKQFRSIVYFIVLVSRCWLSSTALEIPLPGNHWDKLQVRGEPGVGADSRQRPAAW